MRFLDIAALLEHTIAGVQHRSVWPGLKACHFLRFRPLHKASLWNRLEIRQEIGSILGRCIFFFKFQKLFQNERICLKCCPHPCLCKPGFFISPGHMLRCSTPAMVGSKRPAMPQNHMRCAAMHSPTFWNISAIYYPFFKSKLSVKYFKLPSPR